MRIEEHCLRAARRLGDRLSLRIAGRRARTAVGAGIVALCAGTVAGMVASVVPGPFGGEGLARDGYANRDHDEATGSGIAGTFFDASPMRPREESLPAPRWTERERTPRRVRDAMNDASSLRRHHGTRQAAHPAPGFAFASPGGTSSVCVRLCDGFFFPVGDVHGADDVETQTAVCANACPGAPTRLFTTPSGSSGMDKATAARDGAPYTALPVAFAHTAEVGPTCTCHAPGQGEAALMTPLRDITMRDGDTVMTAVGWRVFKGNGHWPYDRQNFTSLSAARDMPAKTRSTLTALENATLGRPARAPVRSAALDIRVRRPTVRRPATDGHEVRLIGTDAIVYR